MCRAQIEAHDGVPGEIKAEMKQPIDRRTLRRGPRPGVGGRPKKTPTRRISARMPEPEYAEFRHLSDDLNENQAILRAIRLWMAMAVQREQAARTGERAEE